MILNENIEKSFLKILKRRLESLKKMGYSPKDIARLLKNKSIVEEFLKISKRIGADSNLIKNLEEIKEVFPTPTTQKQKPKGNFSSKEIKQLEFLLEKYLNILFKEFPGLVKEKERGKIEKIDYFNLKIFYDSKIIKSFPYSRIKIIKWPEGSSILVREDHPSSKLIEPENISEVLTKLEKAITGVELKLKNMAPENQRVEFSKILFNSLFPLTKELGISGKDSEKIIHDLSSN